MRRSSQSAIASRRRCAAPPSQVPVLEANSAPRIGRFGWKSQHASLLSFAADAYLNEMGITSPLFPEENTAGTRFVGYRQRIRPAARAGGRRCRRHGIRGLHARHQSPVARADHADVVKRAKRCSTASDARRAIRRRYGPRVQERRSTAALSRCRPRWATRSFIRTATSCCTTSVLATAFRSCRRAEYAATANQIRTAPLWALRTRNRLMHDGLSYTKQDAIAGMPARRRR